VTTLEVMTLLKYPGLDKRQPTLREMALAQARREAEKTGNLTLWRKPHDHYNQRRAEAINLGPSLSLGSY
jgi:hypothetical protein